jgi:hypothetical protein
MMEGPLGALAVPEAVTRADGLGLPLAGPPRAGEC